MRRDDFPHPVSDPAASGLPEYADDDSSADLDAASPREVDGPDPAPLPPDREDGPLALDEFGTTAEEQRHGEPLDARLAREEPDVETAESAGASQDRADDLASANVPHEWDEPDPDAGGGDDAPIDPDVDSPVSVYERVGPDPVTGGLVGRLVQPDQGIYEDTEADEVAVDAGPSGGGASAEEAAMHEVPDTNEPSRPVR
jgi:hypothetical protein